MIAVQMKTSKLQLFCFVLSFFLLFIFRHYSNALYENHEITGKKSAGLFISLFAILDCSGKTALKNHG